MTKEELARCDGKDGRQACVAINGKVYDVTASSYWAGGNHLDTHQAGADLSADLLLAPHVRSLIERFPVIDELKETPPEEVKSGGGKSLMIVIVVAVVVALGWLLLR